MTLERTQTHPQTHALSDCELTFKLQLVLKPAHSKVVKQQPGYPLEI